MFPGINELMMYCINVLLNNPIMKGTSYYMKNTNGCSDLISD
jgi:hypothetical protein